MASGMVSGMLEKTLPSVPDEMLISMIRNIAGEMLSWVEPDAKQETQPDITETQSTGSTEGLPEK